MLLDEGAVFKDEKGGWQVTDGYIVAPPEKIKTPLDIVETQIRKMIELNDQR